MLQHTNQRPRTIPQQQVLKVKSIASKLNFMSEMPSYEIAKPPFSNEAAGPVYQALTIDR